MTILEKIESIDDVQYAKEYDFLLIEDSSNEALMMDMILIKSGKKYVCGWISDSSLLIEMVRQQKMPEAKLLLLDIRMPVFDGLECLVAIKSSGQKIKTPVVMLSSSDHDKDISKAYGLNCNGYIVKSGSMVEFREKILTTLAYWIQINTIN